MANWIVCKIRYEKTIETGMQKKVTEQYLVDALSFAEAEARIIKEMKHFINGEFTVSAVKKDTLSEVLENTTGGIFYKAKVEFITLNEKTGSEKRTAVNMLVQASDIEESIEILKEFMKGTIADYEITGMNKTQIMDVYRYEVTGKES